MFFFDMRTKLSIIKIIFFQLLYFFYFLFCFVLIIFICFLILKLWILIFITKFLFKRQIWTNWLSFFINSQFNFNSNFFSPLLHVSIHSSINYLHPHTSSSIMSASFPCIACIINQFKTSHFTLWLLHCCSSTFTNVFSFHIKSTQLFTTSGSFNQSLV